MLLDDYPTSEWAQDVHRHLFVNPPTHPLERGYGKTLEPRVALSGRDSN